MLRHVSIEYVITCLITEQNSKGGWLLNSDN